MCMGFANHSNRLCMSKGADQSIMYNWPAHPAPAKICQEPSSVECFISLDSLEIFWTKRQMLIYETLRLACVAQWLSTMNQKVTV